MPYELDATNGDAPARRQVLRRQAQLTRRRVLDWSAGPMGGGSISFAESRSRLSRRDATDRKTVRGALRSDELRRYQPPPGPSMLDSFKDAIRRLRADEPALTGVRIRERIRRSASQDQRRSSMTTYATSRGVCRQSAPTASPPRSASQALRPAEAA